MNKKTICSGVITIALCLTFDTTLFSAAVPLEDKAEKEENTSSVDKDAVKERLMAIPVIGLFGLICNWLQDQSIPIEQETLLIPDVLAEVVITKKDALTALVLMLYPTDKLNRYRRTTDQSLPLLIILDLCFNGSLMQGLDGEVGQKNMRKLKFLFAIGYNISPLTLTTMCKEFSAESFARFKDYHPIINGILYVENQQTTPLIAASRLEDITPFQRVISLGADVNAICPNIGTCLHAFANGDGYGRNITAMSNILLEHHADINLACDFKLENWTKTLTLTPLQLASGNHNHQFVRFLLDHGANPDALTSPDWHPLICALRSPGEIQEAVLQTVTHLIEADADVAARDEHGRSLAEIASINKYPEVAKFLTQVLDGRRAARIALADQPCNFPDGVSDLVLQFAHLDLDRKRPAPHMTTPTVGTVAP